jgi:hypothetical protein
MNSKSGKMKKLGFLIVSLAFLLNTACEEHVKVSEEMKGFLALIDATHSMDEAANQFGYMAEDMPLGYFEIRDPSITASYLENGNTCYDVNVKHGFIDSNVKVCWSENEIISIVEVE